MNEPATVTIVIPTRNSERTLEACLKSVKSQSYPCVIVVVDNQSNDRTLEIANSLADIVLAVEPERSAQRNAGAHATAADILGFIDSDMILSSRVVAEAVEAIQSGAASVVVPERSIGQGYWAGVRAFEREFYRGSDSIEAPRFFLRSVFDKVGGWDEELTGPEDWDLRIRVKQVGVMARIKSEIDHDEGYVRYLDACRKKAYYAPGIARFIQKYTKSGLLQMSSRPWLSQPRLLMNRYGLGLLVLKFGECLAVILALVKLRLTNSFHAKIR